MFGALTSLGFALPWFQSLTDPQAASVRTLQTDEKQHRERAEQAEQQGRQQEAQKERQLERECHNRAIRILMDMVQVKLSDCRRHQWHDAARKHEAELASLEQQIWSDPNAMMNPQQLGQHVTLDQYNQIAPSQLQTNNQSQLQSNNQTYQAEQPPPSYAESQM